MARTDSVIVASMSASVAPFLSNHGNSISETGRKQCVSSGRGPPSGPQPAPDSAPQARVEGVRDPSNGPPNPGIVAAQPLPNAADAEPQTSVRAADVYARGDAADAACDHGRPCSPGVHVPGEPCSAEMKAARLDQPDAARLDKSGQEALLRQLCGAK